MSSSVSVTRTAKTESSETHLLFYKFSIRMQTAVCALEWQKTESQQENRDRDAERESLSWMQRDLQHLRNHGGCSFMLLGDLVVQAANTHMNDWVYPPIKNSYAH